MQTTLESVTALLNVGILVVSLVFIATLCLMVVRLVKMLTRTLEKLSEEILRWQPPEVYTSVSSSASAPSLAHPITGPTTTVSTAPAPGSKLEVTCKHCQETQLLEPIRSEIKADKTILKFICPKCGGEFGKLL